MAETAGGLPDVFSSFKTPMDIQIYLNRLKYNSEKEWKSPSGVVRQMSANCTEGAFFAAAALRHIGYKSYILVMLADDDDDHLLAAFKKNGFWGAVAKSNTTVLRFREPVYRSARELVMSYFDMYFNTAYKKSLRKYCMPVSITKFWKRLMSESSLDHVWEILDNVKYFNILSEEMTKNLAEADDELYKACFICSDWDGLFKPKL